MAALSLILSELHRSWSSVFVSIDTDWNSGIDSGVTSIDLCLNLFEQRNSVSNAYFASNKLCSDFKVMLLSQIDDEITDQCEQIDKALQRMKLALNKCCSEYQRCVSQWEKVVGGLHESDYLTRNDCRPSLEEMFMWLNELVEHYCDDWAIKLCLLKKCVGPVDQESMTQLRRCWKSKYQWQEREAEIKMHIRVFLKTFSTPLILSVVK